MASYNEDQTKKLYYSANDRDSLLESFDAITEEVGKDPEVDHKQSKDGIVTITLNKQLAEGQKIAITVNGREQSYDYNSLPSNVKYDSTDKTITWDITGYDADADLTISYVLSK